MTNQQRMTNQERSELSDKRMFEAAVSLIIEKGTDNTTLKEVGEKAGYSRGLAGYRFGSKSGLFTYVLRRISHYWLHHLDEATKGKSGLAAIQAATLQHSKILEDNTENVRVFYTLWFEGLRDKAELNELVSHINQRRINDIKKWILDDDDLKNKHSQAEEFAALHQCSINGIVYQYLMDGGFSNRIKELHITLNRDTETQLKS